MIHKIVQQMGALSKQFTFLDLVFIFYFQLFSLQDLIILYIYIYIDKGEYKSNP